MNYSSLLNELKKNPDLLQQEVMEACRVDRNAIQMDMVRMSSLYMKWAFLHELAESAARTQKRYIEEDLLPTCRKEAEELCKTQKRKVIKQTLEDIAKEDPGYITAAKELENLQTVAVILKKVEVALLTKRDMLQSLNSRQKVELSALPEDHSSFDFDNNGNGEWEHHLEPETTTTTKTTKKSRLTDEDVEQALTDFEESLRLRWREENSI